MILRSSFRVFALYAGQSVVHDTQLNLILVYMFVWKFANVQGWCCNCLWLSCAIFNPTRTHTDIWELPKTRKHRRRMITKLINNPMFYLFAWFDSTVLKLVHRINDANCCMFSFYIGGGILKLAFLLSKVFFWRNIIWNVSHWNACANKMKHPKNEKTNINNIVLRHFWDVATAARCGGPACFIHFVDKIWQPLCLLTTGECRPPPFVVSERVCPLQIILGAGNRNFKRIHACGFYIPLQSRKVHAGISVRCSLVFICQDGVIKSVDVIGFQTFNSLNVSNDFVTICNGLLGYYAHKLLSVEGPGFMGSSCYGCTPLELDAAPNFSHSICRTLCDCIYGVRITFVPFSPVPETGCPMWHAGLTLTFAMDCTLTLDAMAQHCLPAPILITWW